jgi:PAS domain S-box-containing protein
MQTLGQTRSAAAQEPAFEEQVLDLPSSVFDLLPIGVYVCDIQGRIVRYNRAAATLWGRKPKLDDASDRFCGSLHLYALDGSPIAHADCAMAEVLTNGSPVRNREVVIEQPNGARIVVEMNVNPLRDSAGGVIGAVNCLNDVSERHSSAAITTGDAVRPELDLLKALPVAVYTTDAAGLITFYNQAAAELWGCHPELGKSAFCGSWKLYRPDGRPLAHDECPMAISLREQRAVRNSEAIAERPDGSRVPFIPYPTPLYDRSGHFVGAMNVLIDISDHKRSLRLLAEIVNSSDDAIITKDLNGVITSWNPGAERLFGYTSTETIGRHITMLMPPDRHNEEPGILARLRAGERIDHYETVRQRKDGSLIDISLTVSPVKDEDGIVVGASKVARDITERRLAHERQRLLLREMDHRVKNLFALAGSVVTLSARSTQSVQELASTVNERLAALARAHSLTLPDPTAGDSISERTTTLHTLLRTILSPHDVRAKNPDTRFAIHGIDLPLGGGSVTSFALLFNEFATNAAKYGSLSTSDGTVAIVCSEQKNMIHIQWTEKGGPSTDALAKDKGFGSTLVEATVAQLGGKVSREWRTEGLVIEISVDRNRCMAQVRQRQ